jgi:hypothetical protein
MCVRLGCQELSDAGHHVCGDVGRSVEVSLAPVCGDDHALTLARLAEFGEFESLDCLYSIADGVRPVEQIAVPVVLEVNAGESVEHRQLSLSGYLLVRPYSSLHREVRDIQQRIDFFEKQDQ